VYLDSLGSLVLLLTCAVGPMLIAYLVVDDIWRKIQQRRQPAPVAPVPVSEPNRRFGWFAWANS
jgi:hypothetical protein